MEKSNILSADLIDIVFDGRNKTYGAYELRKTYDKRIRYSIAGTFLVSLLFIVGSLLAGGKKSSTTDLVIAEIDLKALPPKEEEKIPPPKEIPKEQPPVEAVKSTPPKIVRDELVEEKDEIKEVAKLEEATTIATFDRDGVKDETVVAPPVESKGIGVEPLKKGIDEDALMATVQIEAQFPGGLGAWKKFLERNLNSDVPGENGAPAANYTVIVSFVVDRFGNISDVKAENDPGYGTKPEAIKAILKSPKWIPALQNGRNVVYRQRQSITFRVSEN